LSMFKTPKIRSKKHRQFVSTLPCAVCRLEGSTQAAHIRLGNGGGMGLKPCDSNCIPLCVACHAEQGLVGERIFWNDKIEDAKNLSKFLFQYTGNKDAAIMEIVRFR
jgi:hypothetical protein